MKKFISLILAFLMIIGTVAIAAEGDIIHTGNKRVYKQGVDEDQLVEDILNNIDLKKFYREVKDGKFVNIVDEENAQTDYMIRLMEENGLTTPEELTDYMIANKPQIEADLEELITPVDFDEIDDDNKGSFEDYFGSSKAPKLKDINYSSPVPGGENYTSKIITKLLPTGATSWVVKVGEKEFKDLDLDEVIEDSSPYNSGEDIEVKVGQHLLLATIDGGGKLKAYASIEIGASMVNIPRVIVDEDESIEANFAPSESSSGATKILITNALDEDMWKVAILGQDDEVIYKDSKFTNPQDYKENIELVVASDDDLDNDLDGFAKKVIIYKENDEGIEKYNIFNIDKTHVSSLLDARELVMKDDDNPENYNYTKPVKGDSSGTTKIVTLNLPEGASKWMYAFVGADLVPKLDRVVYEASNPYEAGKDIKVSAGNHLMILATDDGGRVKAYGIVTVEAGMVKDPLAMLLSHETHYDNHKKGDNIGHSQITLSDSKTLRDLFDSQPPKINWRYLVSKDGFSIPELNSFIAGTKTLSSDIGFQVVSEDVLLEEDNFNRNLLLLATEGSDDDFKIKGYAQIKLNRDHVQYPSASVLVEDNHYSVPTKGPSHGSTEISSLKASGIENHFAWWVKVVSGTEPAPVEHKELINTTKGFRSYSQGAPITVNDSNYLVLVSVDRNGKALAYKNIGLNDENVTAPGAAPLRDGSHYEGPEAGSIAKSSRFSKFYSADSNWFVKVGDRHFGIVESGIEIKPTEDGFKEYEAGHDIENLRPGQVVLLVRTDKANKVNGYVNITLKSIDIRSDDAQKIRESNYKITKGDAPGNIKIYDLVRGGIEAPNFNGWKWMYKLIDTELTGEALPYLNQKFSDARNLSENPNLNEGNIDVGNPPYGHILLLATDSGGQVKAYGQIKINPDMVRESAPGLEIDIEPGDSIDRVKFKGNNLKDSYMYKMDTKAIPSPALNEVLYGAKEYIVNGNVGIIASVGSHLMIYEVDIDNKVQAYKSFIIEDKHIKKGAVAIDKNFELLQGNIENGGEVISFTLDPQDRWTDVKSDPGIRNKLYDGLKASSENTQWLKVVNTLKSGGPGNIFVDGNTVSIRLPATEGYNISEDQEIKLTVPFEAVDGAIRPIDATGSIIIRPTLDLSVSGTLVSDIVRESDIKNGGATIELILKDSYWNMDVKDILANSYVVGVDHDKQGNTNWSKVKAAVVANPNSIIVVNEKTVRITLPPVNSGIAFGSNKEVITMVIDGKHIQGAKAGEQIVARPTFTIYPDVLKIETKLADEENKVVLKAPDNKAPLEGKDTWTVELTNATLRDGMTDKDVSIIGMPPGLKHLVTRLSDNQLSIQLTGSANSSLVDGNIRLVVKGSAVKELNSIDSDDLYLPYVKGSPMSLTGINYEIQNDGIYLHMEDGFDYSKIEYSLDSKNGINGEWHNISGLNPRVNELVGPVTIYVREKAQPKVFRKIVDLNHLEAPLVEVKQYDYIIKDGETLLNMTLESEVSDLEYRLDDDLTWWDLSNDESGNKVVKNLDYSSILIVREKGILGIEGKLPSLPTPKLNGLFLGNIELDVSQSKIMGATRDMRYRLAQNGTWNSISINDPIVAFKEGNEVYIKDAKIEENFHYLGKIEQSSFSTGEEDKVKKILEEETDTDGIYYHIGEKKIVNKTDVNLQYNITKGAVPTGNWIKLRVNETINNVNFIPGNVFVRKVDDGKSLPSNPVNIFEIAEPINPPKIEVNQDNKTLMFESSAGVYEDLNDTFEYKIGNGDYYNGSLFKNDPQRLGNITVTVKRKATKKLLASKEISIKFTENISLANVRVNVADGTIEGTTTKMEYRTDENSPWKVASNTRTSINMYKGMNIWIRELGKPSTIKEILLNLEQMNKPGENDLQYDVSQKFITNNSKVILEYRINNDSWKTINVGETISIEFLPTKLSIRTKATADRLASDMVDVMKDLDYPGKAPDVEMDDKLNQIKSVDGISRDDNKWGPYEFKLNTDTEWIPGNNLINYDLSGDKIVQIRMKGSAVELPSEILEVIFTKNIDVDKVEFREGTPLRLIKTEVEMEYQVYLKDKPIPTIWIKASAGTTNLDSLIKFGDINLIVVRDSRNRDDLKVLIGTENELPVDLKDVSYEISATGIAFMGVSNRMKYKLSSSDNWEDGNGDKVIVDSLDLMEVTIQDSLYPEINRTITINERAETPEVIIKKVEYSGSTMTLTLDNFTPADVEYSLNNGEWTTSESKVFTIHKGDTLKLRAKAIAGGEGVGKLPSLPTHNLNTTSLLDVSVKVDKPSLINTTKFMEYSLNSNDGKDGTWTVAKDDETPMAIKLGTVIWVREINNTANARKIGPIKQEAIPILPSDALYYNIAKGKIANFTDQNLEYRVAGGGWKPINETLDNSKVALNVEFNSGPLEFRQIGNGSNFPSNPIVLTTITVPGSKPKFVSNDTDNTIILPGDVDKYEYTITSDGITSPWKSGLELANEDFSGKKTVRIRRKATSTELPSEVQEIEFTSNPLKKVNLSTHVKPYELNGTTTEMEYRVWLINDTNTEWVFENKWITAGKDVTELHGSLVLATSGNRISRIEIRYIEKVEDIITVYPLLQP